jgi:hypothetical protein
LRHKANITAHFPTLSILNLGGILPQPSQSTS